MIVTPRAKRVEDRYRFIPFALDIVTNYALDCTRLSPTRACSQAIPHPVSLRSLHLWRMPEMVAPRALVFRPLVKGNEDSGNEIVTSVFSEGGKIITHVHNHVLFCSLNLLFGDVSVPVVVF